MTKQEFEILHEICKKEWLTLAKTGESSHTFLVQPFHAGCPACEIPKSVIHSYTGRCIYCPVDVWREADTLVACNDFPSPFANWIEVGGDLELAQEEERDEEVLSDYREALRGFAQEIADLKWSWLPEYEQTQLTQKVKDAIELFQSSKQP